MRPKPACFNLTEEQIDALHPEAAIYDAGTGGGYWHRAGTPWPTWNRYRGGRCIDQDTTAELAIRMFGFVTEPVSAEELDRLIKRGGRV